MHRRSRGPARPAFVASTGGHLVEMRMMAQILEPHRYDDAVWITHSTLQSLTMLAGEDVHYVAPIHPRDWWSLIRRIPEVIGILRHSNVDRVYSTGAGIALSTLPWAPLVGARPAYIESLARVVSPSATGRMLERLPWVPVFTQYQHNTSPRWEHQFSLLDAFVTTRTEAPSPKRIFVTLGTQRDFLFRRLIDRLLLILPGDVEVTWQTGATQFPEMPLHATAMMSEAEFRHHVETADVVISHAGAGTLLTCLEVGRVPVVVPRRAAYGEHVDDHQVQIAAVAAARGLAVMKDAGELSMADLRAASSMRAVRRGPRDGPGVTAVGTTR